jgi:hypothetical protein
VRPRFPLITALLAVHFMLLLAPALMRGQVTVDLSIKRTIFVAYEPLLATVRITNLTGARLLLADVQSTKWFGFQIETLDGRPIPPSDPDYEIAPIQIEPGDSITRTVNLTQLYPLGDLGSYRIRASVYAAELSSYFTSPPLTVEITEGRLIWQQTVGVPGGAGITGTTRTISLLTHRLADKTDLYLRIEDKQAGVIYCTHRLGDCISFGKPEIQLDAENGIHVLQNNIPREFIYSKVGLDGKILERLTYSAPKDRPQLVRGSDGSVSVHGGIPYDPKASPTPAVIPKLSDRPVAFDAPMPSLTPEKSPLPPSKNSTKHPSGKPGSSPSPKPRTAVQTNPPSLPASRID